MKNEFLVLNTGTQNSEVKYNLNSTYCKNDG